MPQISLNVRQHVYALMYDQIGMCGCGLPERSLQLVRDLLIAARDRTGMTSVIDNEGARHIVLSVLENVGLLEHGGVIAGAWLTRKGDWYLRALEQMEWEDIEDGEGGIGLPHDGKPCTELCLKAFWVSA